MYLLNGSEVKPMNTKPILRIRKNYRFVMQWAIFSNSYLSVSYTHLDVYKRQFIHFCKNALETDTVVGTPCIEVVPVFI